MSVLPPQLIPTNQRLLMPCVKNTFIDIRDDDLLAEPQGSRRRSRSASDVDSRAFERQLHSLLYRSSISPSMKGKMGRKDSDAVSVNSSEDSTVCSESDQIESILSFVQELLLSSFLNLRHAEFTKCRIGNLISARAKLYVPVQRRPRKAFALPLLRSMACVMEPQLTEKGIKTELRAHALRLQMKIPLLVEVSIEPVYPGTRYDSCRVNQE